MCIIVWDTEFSTQAIRTAAAVIIPVVPKRIAMLQRHKVARQQYIRLLYSCTRMCLYPNINPLLLPVQQPFSFLAVGSVIKQDLLLPRLLPLKL